MTTDTSRRTLRIVGPSLGVDFTVRYAETLGEHLPALAARVQEQAGARLPAGARLRFTYLDHDGHLVTAWPTDSVEWLMKRAPVLTVAPADADDAPAVSP